MKNKCFLLVKNRLIAQMGINEIRYGKNKKKRSSKLLLLLAMVIVVLVMAFYAGGTAYSLCYLGASDLVPTIGFFVGSMIALLFTIFKTSGELFGYRDYDFLMSIPVKTSTVIASRFINMYLWNTSLTLLVMLPMGIVYAIWEKPGWFFYPVWLIGSLIVCFLPTTVAVIIGTLITAVSSRFRRSNMVSAILLILLISGVLVGSFSLPNSKLALDNGALNEVYIKAMLGEARGIIEGTYPPVKLFSQAVVEGSFISMILLIGISVGWYLLFVWVLTFGYKKINTAVSSRHTASNYRVHGLKQKGILGALYGKEIRRWTGCSVYFTNTIVGVVMAVLASAALMIFGPDKLSEAMKDPNAGKYTVSAASYVIGACIGMCCTTMASISLEGKNLWILQSLPVTMKAIIHSKLLVDLSVTIPSALICSTMLVIGLKPGMTGALVYYLIPVAFSLITAVWGLMINLMLPNYEWESETQVVKQSVPSLLGMIPGLLLGILLAVLSILAPIDYRVFGLVCGVVLLGGAWFMYIIILKRYKTMPVQ